MLVINHIFHNQTTKKFNCYKVLIVVSVYYVEYNVTLIKIFRPEELVNHKLSAQS